MSIMNEASSTQSLVIAEGNNDFQINSSEQKPKKDEDLFDLSSDEVSLSFKIEQEKKMMVIRQLARQSQEDSLVLNIIEPPLEQNRKKRKEIFDRNKRLEGSIANRIQSSKTEDNLLSIFDQIFKTKSPGSIPFCGGEAFRQSGNLAPILQDQSIRSRTPSVERKRLKIFDKKKEVKTFQGILPPDILDDTLSYPAAVMHTKSNVIQATSPVRSKRNEDAMSFSNIENRFSAIDYADDEYSRESVQINNILQSQLFKDESEEKQNQLTQLKTVQPSNRFSGQFQSKISQPIVRQPVKSNRIQIKIQKPRQLKVNEINTPTQVQQVKPRAFEIARHISLQSNQSPNFTKKTGPKVHSVGQIPQEIKLSPLRQLSDHKIQISPTPITNIQKTAQQVEQSIFMANDFSSVSSSPSIYVQNYNSSNGAFQPETSTVNVKGHIFGNATSFKTIQFGDKKFSIKNSILAQSQVIENIQRLQMNHKYQQQIRLPLFLREIRKRISIYPNLNLIVNNPNTSQAVANEFAQLFINFKKGISFLSEMCQKLLEAKSKLQLYTQQLMNNLSLDFFMQSGWQSINKFQGIQLIRPTQPIQMRGWSYQKAKTALANYENIINYYNAKGVQLDVTSEKGKKKYFQIRQKFWDICGNMKLISEDIFLQMRNCLLPHHYYQFQTYMTSDFSSRINQSRLNYLKKLMNLYRYQKGQNDPLVCSVIGDKIKQKLSLQLSYIAPY